MSGMLETILELLDPRIVAESINIPHAYARNSYPPQPQPQSFYEFRDMLQAYYRHHCITTKQGYPELKEMSTGKALDIVKAAFGNQGGIDGAYKIAHGGIGDGIYTSFDAIAKHLKNDHLNKYIQHIIDNYINPVSFEQRVALVRSIMKEFPAPGEYDKKTPEELANNYYALVTGLVQRMMSEIPLYLHLKE
jgi:hypothetical protein